MCTPAVLSDSVYSSCTVGQCTPAVLSVCTPAVLSDSVYSSCTVRQCVLQLYCWTVCTPAVLSDSVYSSCTVGQCVLHLHCRGTQGIKPTTTSLGRGPCVCEMKSARRCCRCWRYLSQGAGSPQGPLWRVFASSQARRVVPLGWTFNYPCHR